MRFEEERVACSMVRGEKNSKRPPLAPLGVGMDYSVGRALRHARFGGGIMARGWREFATCLVVASPERRLEVRSPGIPLFFHLSPCSNKNWLIMRGWSKVGNISEQNWLKGLQMVQFECTRHPIPCVLLRLGEFQELETGSAKFLRIPAMSENSTGMPQKIYICCKWSSLNAPGTQSLVSYSGWENSKS